MNCCELNIDDVRKNFRSADQSASAEEKALAELLQRLIQAYDDEHYPMPEVPPHEMVKYLMQQRCLKQADLVPLLGSRAPQVRVNRRSDEGQLGRHPRA